MTDPFAPARRALVFGPLMLLAGAALVYFGISREGAAWLLCVPGGILVLLGLIRILGGGAVLLIERQRKTLLREGAQSTAVIKSAERVETKFGYPIYKLELLVRLPNGSEQPATKSGAIPHQFDGSLEPGDELPIRIRPEDREFAIDWGGGF